MTNERANRGDLPEPSRVALLDDQGIFELPANGSPDRGSWAPPPTRRDPRTGSCERWSRPATTACPSIRTKRKWREWRAVATLAEAAVGGRIDIVDVFRRAELTEETARDAVAVGAERCGFSSAW